MALSPDAVIDAYWQAVEDLPENSVSPVGVMQLLAGLCHHLGRVEPSERFEEVELENRETLEQLGTIQSGTNVRLAYVYSALGDGFVDLEIFNAEAVEPGESGTVIGTPGARVKFDLNEARRAIQILQATFPAAAGSDPSQP